MPLILGFQDVFQEYEMPLKPTSMAQSYLYRITEVDKAWSIDYRAARIYLDKRLVTRAGNFDFLALPSELRLLIYEYALSYPTLRPALFRSVGRRFKPCDTMDPDVYIQT